MTYELPNARARKVVSTNKRNPPASGTRLIVKYVTEGRGQGREEDRGRGEKQKQKSRE